VTRRSTIGDRAFPVAAARAWNSLLSFVTSSIVVTVDFQTTFEDVPVCDLVLMALLTLLFLSLSSEHVVFFVCYASLQFLD